MTQECSIHCTADDMGRSHHNQEGGMQICRFPESPESQQGPSSQDRLQTETGGESSSSVAGNQEFNRDRELQRPPVIFLFTFRVDRNFWEKVCAHRDTRMRASLQLEHFSIHLDGVSAWLSFVS